MREREEKKKKNLFLLFCVCLEGFLKYLFYFKLIYLSFQQTLVTKMATIRHDFSFPPKSNSLNNNNNNNRQQQNVGLSSSATAPIFSSYKFNDSSHMMIRTPTVSAPKPFNKYKTAHYTTHSVYTHQKHSVF